jgi:hypothetical protein
MAQPRTKISSSLHPFLLVVGSLAILLHFGAVLVHTLAAPSGPWPTPDGMSMADPPAFTQSLDQTVVRGYLTPLKLTHNFHFAGNHPAPPGVFIEARLKDSKGDLITTLRLPDPQANAWTRHLQALFIQSLVPDQPRPPMQGEAIPAPHQQVKLVSIWEHAPDDSLRLQQVAEHLVPRNREVFSPTEWSMVLVRSYARYLCRKHGAASVEIVRHSRNPFNASWLLTGNPPPMAFQDLIASYGDISGE